MILAFIFVFIVYRTGTGPNVLIRLYTLIKLYLLTGDIFDKLRQRHSTYVFGIATLELEVVDISSATKSKLIACKLPFENQLFGYYHCCTEININLLLNTFSPYFRWISLRICKMCILEKLSFKNSRGSIPPDPPSVLAPLALDPMGNTQYNITCLNYTNRCFFFSVEKGAPSVLYRDTYFKDCRH